MKTAHWLVAALLALPLTACGLLDSPDKQRAEAEAALARGDYGEAAITLRNLLEDDADNAELRLALARTLFMQGDADGARRTLAAAVDSGAPAQDVAVLRARWNLADGDYQVLLDATSDPEVAFTEEQRKYYRARALQGLRRVPEAIAIFREMAAAQPQSADLQLRLAQAHAFLGRIDAARASLDAALARPAADGEIPVKAEAWLLKGTLAERDNDMEAVGEAYRNAAEAAPGELSALEQGQLLTGAVDHALRAGDLEAARAYRSQLARVLPQSSLARMMGAQVRLHEEGDPAEAIAELQRLSLDQPDSELVRLLLIAGQLRAGSLEQALADVRTLAAASSSEGISRVEELVRAAIAAPAQSADRALNISAALGTIAQPGMARLVLKQALVQHPDDAGLLRAQVQAELRAGRADEAARLAQQLVERFPEMPVARGLLAEAQVAARDYAAAARTYETLWETNPNSALALAYAESRSRAGIADAELPLRQWLQRQPRDQIVRLALASALQQAGESAEAIREFQRALNDLPAGHPMRPIAQNNLALLYAQTGDGRALATAREAHQAAGSVPAIQDTYGWLLVRNGRAEEGLPLLQSAAEALPASPEVRYHYAAALAATGDEGAAGVLLADLLASDQPFEGRSDAEKLRATL